MGDTFAFIIHPINIKRDVERKYPFLGRVLTEAQINFFSRFFPPVYLSEIEGVVSVDTGNDLNGWLLACPFTPPTMMSVRTETAYNKIVACGHMAEELGAKMLGLGAYTSIVGDGGKTIADRLNIPVTTGDSYTVAIAIDAIREAARVMGYDHYDAQVAVVGATGAIGKACAQMLASECAELVLVGRDKARTEAVRELCEGQRALVTAHTDMRAIYNADLIVTVTNALEAVIEPEHLKPGCVVTDVARPRDVSRRVAEVRDDVLIVEGGMVEVPGPVDFHFDFGFPPGKAFACMAETMALALEGRYEDYSVGKEVDVQQVREISEIAARHGFKLSGFRTFELPVTDDHIARVREQAAVRRKTWTPLAS